MRPAKRKSDSPGEYDRCTKKNRPRIEGGFFMCDCMINE
jgi:hypothetical protein